ncbi:hypothetical protein ColLi_11483 [Colletotrichum liriopes]|uniref:Uncharacterized protein n=1 Tax=Colletotrichum liriopes TaxID=708192 RepID=A0AA37LX30_9PEZI|nr:hypothetical protein ColLi_11483 [Colletotrichum liriopes]
MSHDSADPSTPQRPLPSPLDEAAVTPSRLGLLQTPPRRPGRGLKRPAEAEPDAPGRREASPLRLLQTPPQRPPRRARFSTGFVDLATPGPADTTSQADQPVSDLEKVQRCTPGAEREDEQRDEETPGRWDENKSYRKSMQKSSGMIIPKSPTVALWSCINWNPTSLNCANLNSNNSSHRLDLNRTNRDRTSHNHY